MPATKKRVTIIEEDIELGIPRTSWACAIVMALQREYPALEPSVVPVNGGHEVRMYGYIGTIDPAPQLQSQYRLSKNASKWIHKFDKQGVGVPATFEMTLIN